MQQLIKMLLDFFPVFLLVCLNCFIIKSLVDGRIVRIHVDLIVAELDAFLWSLVEDNVEFDFVVPALCLFSENGMHQHFLP